mmetsp:Transcript_37123/g.37798  ORF Transcript_37123/g.37798 Transcript_37123/m.37798 type:complete len:285 (+) Transcript_37123:88-942(+)
MLNRRSASPQLRPKPILGSAYYKNEYYYRSKKIVLEPIRRSSNNNPSDWCHRRPHTSSTSENNRKYSRSNSIIRPSTSSCLIQPTSITAPSNNNNNQTDNSNICQLNRYDIMVLSGEESKNNNNNNLDVSEPNISDDQDNQELPSELPFETEYQSKELNLNKINLNSSDIINSEEKQEEGDMESSMGNDTVSSTDNEPESLSSTPYKYPIPMLEQSICYKLALTLSDQNSARSIVQPLSSNFKKKIRHPERPMTGPYRGSTPVLRSVVKLHSPVALWDTGNLDL